MLISSSYREISTTSPSETSSPPSKSTRKSVGDYLSSVVKPHPLPPASSPSSASPSMWSSSTGTTRSKGHQRLRKPRSNSQIIAQRSRAGTVGSVKSSTQSSDVSGGHTTGPIARLYRGTAEADILAELWAGTTPLLGRGPTRYPHSQHHQSQWILQTPRAA